MTCAGALLPQALAKALSVTGITGCQHHNPSPKLSCLSMQSELRLGRDGIQKLTPAYTEEVRVGSDALLEVGGFGQEFCVELAVKAETNSWN